MARIKFTRIESSEKLNDVDFVDGQIIACGDGKIYLDYNSKRANCGGLNIEDVLNVLNTTKEIMDIGLKEHTNIEIPSAYSYNKVPFNVLKNSIGDKLTFKNGEIIIGKGVSKIKISSTFMLNDIVGHLYAGATLNGQSITNGYVTKDTDGWINISQSPQLFDVKEGDIVGGFVGANTTGNLTVAGGNGVFSFIEVEVVA